MAEEVSLIARSTVSFRELGYMLEAAKVADSHLRAKPAEVLAAEEKHALGNLRAKRQCFLRAVFIASQEILEQYVIALTETDCNVGGSVLAAADRIDTDLPRWRNLLLLQDIRDHLVRLGPALGNTASQRSRFLPLEDFCYVTLSPSISFTIEQIEKIFCLYSECLEDFTH